MKRLLLHPAGLDAETTRITRLLAQQPHTSSKTLKHVHPAQLAFDAWKLRAETSPEIVLHAFGIAALNLSLFASRNPVIYSSIGFPTARQIAWLRAASGYRRIEILCTSDTMRRAFVTRGLSPDQCHLVRPGVKFSTIPTSRNNALRTKLGFAESDQIIFAPLEFTFTSGHGLTCFSASLVQILKPNHKLLVWGRGAKRSILDHMQSRVMDPKMTTIATDIDPTIEIETLFGAADSILMTPSGPVSPMIVAMAMASGKPIVSTVTPQVCEMIEDRHTCLFVQKPSPKYVAQRMIDLISDPTLGWQIQDRARAEAYDLFTTSKYLEAIEKIYARVEGSRHSTESPILANPSEA